MLHICSVSLDSVLCELIKYTAVSSLGNTKLIRWSSDFVFENEERASEIFIFV